MEDSGLKLKKQIERIGVVVSDKANKTRSILADRSFLHPIFKKIVKKSSVIIVHDENNVSKEGDQVKIIESRPISKRKRWRIVSVIFTKGAGVKAGSSLSRVESSDNKVAGGEILQEKNSEGAL
jgi:small subunit ribosomal protein S17